MEDRSDDALLRERAFKRGAGLDLSGFQVNLEQEEAGTAEAPPSSIGEDEAVGEVSSPFSRSTIDSETPPSSSLAGEGERHIGNGLLVAMVVAYSAFAAYVGTALNPGIAAPGLLLLGTAGLLLGERWIPKPSMRLLGVTWVIISMKVLYGLALDVHHWGWLDGLPVASGPALGALLLLLVVLNVLLAQRHDDDAIAAQATLILLLVGSAAGGVYGEAGVVVMIALGTAVLHGMALLRGTGNLASLGIAASYLWIGIHALSNAWSVLGLPIVPFEDGMLTFLLMAWVTGLNALMAARFARHDNWFSSAAAALGLGRPGLWAVSVGLGMGGAVLAVAAHREDTGYALAQVALLLTAFTGSYLSVRGVAWSRLSTGMLWVPLVATLTLVPVVVMDLLQGLASAPSPYALHAAIMMGCAATAVLRHEAQVSDHVLWVGSIALVVLLSLLVPTGTGTDMEALLAGGVLAVWGGLGLLALRRDAPSLAGTAVLGPWSWALLFVGDLDQRLFALDLVSIAFGESVLTFFLLGALCLTLVVNHKLGDVGLNLGRRFVGGTELSARVRDAGTLDLWTMATALAIVTVLAAATTRSIDASLGLALLLAPLAVEALMAVAGARRLRPSRTMSMTGMAALAFAWSAGQPGLLALGLALPTGLLLWDGPRREASTDDQDLRKAMETNPSTHHGLLLTLLTVLALVRWLRPDVATGGVPLDAEADLFVFFAVAGCALLPFGWSTVLEDTIGRSVAAALGLLITLLMLGLQAEQLVLQAAAGMLFLLLGAWLSAQAEVRAALSSTARIEARREAEEAAAARRLAFQERADVADGAMLRLEDGKEGQSLDVVDASALRRASQTGKASTAAPGLEGLEHRPTVLMSFIVALGLACTAWAYVGGTHSVVLAALAIGTAAFIALARSKSDDIGLPLPQMAGVDLPIVLGLAGLALADVAGRMGGRVVLLEDQVHTYAFLSGLFLFGALAVLGRSHLGLRLPAVADALLATMLASRLLALAAGGEVPVPFLIDPWAGSLVSWTVPLLLSEAVLVALVVLHEWVEGARHRRGLGDTRGAAGRLFTAGAVVMLSFGLASLLVVAVGLRRGVKWTQPAVAVGCALAFPLAWSSFAFWSPVRVPGLLEASIALGAVALLVAVWVHATGRPLWLAGAIQTAHVALVPSLWATFGLTGLVVGLLILSLASWVLGVLSLRRSWRIVGLADLLAAWLGFGMALIGGETGLGVLTMLATTVLVLSAVTYLTQREANALSED